MERPFGDEQGTSSRGTSSTPKRLKAKEKNYEECSASDVAFSESLEISQEEKNSIVSQCLQPILAAFEEDKLDKKRSCKSILYFLSQMSVSAGYKFENRLKNMLIFKNEITTDGSKNLCTYLMIQHCMFMSQEECKKAAAYDKQWCEKWRKLLLGLVNCYWQGEGVGSGQHVAVRLFIEEYFFNEAYLPDFQVEETASNVREIQFKNKFHPQGQVPLFSNFPQEILEKIVLQLPHRDMLSILRVCQLSYAKARGFIGRVKENGIIYFAVGGNYGYREHSTVNEVGDYGQLIVTFHKELVFYREKLEEGVADSVFGQKKLKLFSSLRQAVFYSQSKQKKISHGNVSQPTVMILKCLNRDIDSLQEKNVTKTILHEELERKKKYSLPVSYISASNDSRVIPEIVFYPELDFFSTEKILSTRKIIPLSFGAKAQNITEAQNTHIRKLGIVTLVFCMISAVIVGAIFFMVFGFMVGNIAGMVWVGALSTKMLVSLILGEAATMLAGGCVGGSISYYLGKNYFFKEKKSKNIEEYRIDFSRITDTSSDGDKPIAECVVSLDPSVNGYDQ